VAPPFRRNYGQLFNAVKPAAAVTTDAFDSTIARGGRCNGGDAPAQYQQLDATVHSSGSSGECDQREKCVSTT